MEKLSSEIETQKKEFESLRKEFLQLCTQAIVEDRPFEKDPQMAKFSFANHNLGKVYGRTRAESVSYDTAALLQHPVLKEVVLESTVYDVDEKKLDEIMTNHPELVPVIQREFIAKKKPSIRLSPVRDISPEDL